MLAWINRRNINGNDGIGGSENKMRTCGDCTYCCKLLGVSELEKPAMSWCSHCDTNKGCTIYADRPSSCKEFECLWLQIEALPEDLRPDKCKIILAATKDGEGVVAYVEQHNEHLLHEGKMHGFLRTLVNKGRVIIAVVGANMREVIYSRNNAPKDLLTKIEEYKNAHNM